MPIKVHFEWVLQKKGAKRKSAYHRRVMLLRISLYGLGLLQSRLEAGRNKIREKYAQLVHGGARVKASNRFGWWHGMACGEGVFNRLAVIIIGKDFNIERVRQPRNTPIFNIFDLTI